MERIFYFIPVKLKFIPSIFEDIMERTFNFIPVKFNCREAGINTNGIAYVRTLLNRFMQWIARFSASPCLK